MLKKLSSIAVIWFCLQVAAHASASAPIILVLGDSLSSGHGIAIEQGWVHLLQQRLGQNGYPHQVVNASVSGDTTANGLTRLPSALNHRPRIVILELGGNDGLRAQSVAAIRQNLVAIIRAAREAGAAILLAGIRLPPNYGPVYVQRFEAIFPELSQSFATGLIPFFMQGVATAPDLMQADGIHPNARAQYILLENLWPHLQPMLDRAVPKAE